MFFKATVFELSFYSLNLRKTRNDLGKDTYNAIQAIKVDWGRLVALTNCNTRVQDILIQDWASTSMLALKHVHVCKKPEDYVEGSHPDSRQFPETIHRLVGKQDVEIREDA